MHCPNCGNQAAAEQKFCRSCGLELQAISQLVGQQLSGETVTTPAKSEVEPVARMARMLFLGICILLVGMGLLALDKKFGSGASIGLLGLLMVLGGPLLALYAILAPMMHPHKARRQSPPPAVLPSAETTSKLALASGAEPVLSVVEHTTRTLEPVGRKTDEQV